MQNARVLVFVDGANIMAQAQDFSRRPNFRTLIDSCVGHNFLVDAYVYLPLPHTNREGVLRFHDHLRSMGLQVVAKRAKMLPDGTTKCDMDMELGMDAMELCQDIKPDMMVLASGDGDFAPLIQRIRRRGIVTAVASCHGSLANELRLVSQNFVDLTKWRESQKENQ